MRKNKNTSKIILAIIVAFLATLISYSAFSNMKNEINEQQQLIEVMQKSPPPGNTEGSYAYAIATDNLKAGEIVSDEDVDFKSFDTINTNAFENRSDVINKVLLKDINSGDVFNATHIAKISGDNTDLREGYRALTLPADNFQGKSVQMNIGTAIDIYSASAEDNWIMENVKIIGLEGGSTPNSGIKDATSITFEVASDDISDFISQVSKSKLVLVMRNAKDKKTVSHKKKRPNYNNYNASIPAALPNLPASVPITNMSGLPEPIAPEVQKPSVELIEANVKSKVTFD